MLLGSWVALLVSFILEVGQAFLLDTNKYMAMLQVSQTNIWQTNPMMLLLAVVFIAFALFYAPRQPIRTWQAIEACCSQLILWRISRRPVATLPL